LLCNQYNPEIRRQIRESADKITIFGWLEDWRNSPNETVKNAFAQLTGTLKEKNVGLYHQSMREDGTYGSEIGKAGEIKITF
jgi:hypothetical protein